jgi:hypothetical protein
MRQCRGALGLPVKHAQRCCVDCGVIATAAPEDRLVQLGRVREAATRGDRAVLRDARLQRSDVLVVDAAEAVVREMTCSLAG